MSDKNYKVIDCFPYFDETGNELLRLRVEMLKAYVDYFIITESNKTQSGIPINRKLRDRIEEYNLPKDKIIIIDLNIPDSSELIIEDIDAINCYEDNHTNRNSLLARVRERMQKDAILSEINRFSDDDVFIISDSDEIIIPEIINFYSKEVKKYPDHILKFPLVHLEGRADLRVVHKVTGEPKWWDSLFMCTKKHLLRATPTQIRSNVNNPFIRTNYYQDGVICKDLGWHFSWMGGSEKRKMKATSFTHFDDKLSFLEKSKYKKSDDLLKNRPQPGSICPSGDVNYILEKYPINDLPDEIFKFNDIKNFLFDTGDSIFKNEYISACYTPSDINEHLPILYSLATECSHITEFGVRDGKSTRAFLYADVILRSYDLYIDNTVYELFENAKLENRDVKYIKGDSTQIDIEETDLLFIDTWHCYEQLKNELARHHGKVKKYIVFHDTHSFGIHGEKHSGSPSEILTDTLDNPLGIIPAIIEFMIENTNWVFHIHKNNNNGLTVIKRI